MDFQVSKFEGDRLQIGFLLYLSKRRNYSSVKDF